MSETTRREILGRLAAAFAAAAAIDKVAAQQAHQFVQQTGTAAGGGYQPRALTAAEFRTLERLTDLIIPVENGRPGAVGADVPAWIDSLLAVNDELTSKYRAGFGWLDTAMKERHGVDFAGATPTQQTGLLDRIAFQKNRSAQLDPGIDFFILARRMTVDGFYTSPIGSRDIWKGGPQAEFNVPQEAYDYVLRRSPFR